MIKSPMLAEKLPSIDKVKYPVLCTPKLDGIRCLIINGQAVSRKFKIIPNNYIREQLNGLPDNLDGELITYTNGIRDNFNIVSSKVMSEDGEPEFTFEVFDYVTTTLIKPYRDRMYDLNMVHLPNFINKLIPHVVCDKDELLWYENKCLNEDLNIDCPDHPYSKNEDYAPEYVYISHKMHDSNKYKYYNNVCILTKIKCDRVCSICDKRMRHEKTIEEINSRIIEYYDVLPSYGSVWGH